VDLGRSETSPAGVTFPAGVDRGWIAPVAGRAGLPATA